MKTHYKIIIISSLLLCLLLSVNVLAESMPDLPAAGSGIDFGSLLPIEYYISDSENPSGNETEPDPVQDPQTPEAPAPDPVIIPENPLPEFTPLIPENNENEDKTEDPGSVGDSGNERPENNTVSPDSGNNYSNSDFAALFGDLVVYSLSSDAIMIDQLTKISNSMDKIIKNNNEQKKNYETYYLDFTKDNEHEREFQEKVLSILSSIKDSLSVNREPVPVDVTVSVNFPEVSENLIEEEEIISENETPLPEDPEEVISSNSVSADDIAVIHNDLKNIFYVLIVATAFLTIIAATSFEQLIFRRMKS